MILPSYLVNLVPSTIRPFVYLMLTILCGDISQISSLESLWILNTVLCFINHIQMVVEQLGLFTSSFFVLSCCCRNFVVNHVSSITLQASFVQFADIHVVTSYSILSLWSTCCSSSCLLKLSYWPITFWHFYIWGVIL